MVEDLDAPGGAETAVLTVDGEVLGNGDLDPDDPEVRRALGGDAFEVVDDSGGRVLLPVVNDQGTAVVRTSVGPEVLHAGVTSAWLGIIGLGVLLLALAGATAAWQGRRLAEPLREVAGTAHELRGGNLAARAQVRGTGPRSWPGHSTAWPNGSASCWRRSGPRSETSPTGSGLR